MEKYIGIKLIEAEPNGEGYTVKYPDGYESYSPKDVFEKAYLKVSKNENLKSDISISQDMVDRFIVDYEVFTKKNKITIVIATLVNGFTIVESSACVDPENYDEKIGAEICKQRIINQVWNHLGFLLQCGVGGIK